MDLIFALFESLAIVILLYMLCIYHIGAGCFFHLLVLVHLVQRLWFYGRCLRNNSYILLLNRLATYASVLIGFQEN